MSYGNEVTIGFTAPPPALPRAEEVALMLDRAEKQVQDALGPADTAGDRPPVDRGATLLERRIDHTALAPTVDRHFVEMLCKEAKQHRFASVCVNPRWVPYAAGLLADSDVRVCTVVGFPLGANRTEAKVFETRLAVDDGADEIDMVVDIASLRSGDLRAVFDDVRAVVQAAEPKPVKAILETALLSEEQVVVGCLLAARAGVAYVKTSTGFSSGGATVRNVALMRAAVGDDLGVKASGNVRTRADAEAMVAAGADRIGTSASVTISAGR